MLFGLLLSFIPTQEVYSGIIIDDPLANESGDNKGGVRSVSATINTSTDGDFATFDVNRFMGIASVTVSSADLPNVFVDDFFIRGHTSFTLDFSDYHAGVYTITITLSNGQIFTGQMIKE